MGPTAFRPLHQACVWTFDSSIQGAQPNEPHDLNVFH